jgi:hypothetical protein
MTPEQVRTLVEQVVAAVIAAQAAPAAPAAPRPVLFLFSGAEQGMADALALLRGVAVHGPVTALACPCHTAGIDGLREAIAAGRGTLIESPHMADARAALAASAGLCIAQPTAAMLARAARGMADTLASRILVEALAQGHPSFAAGGEADTDRWPATMPPAMRRGPRSLGEWLAEDLRALESWGLVFRRTPAELHGPLVNLWKPGAAPVVQKATDGYAEIAPASGFLTADDIRKCHREGLMAIAPAKGIRITALARDEAARLGVQVRE